MRITAIRIKNLASLEGVTEIDFTQEPLRAAGIFAITGPTGSGKSTILDALCLALYAKTPRYVQAKEMGIDILDVQGSTISQSDARGILRDGTAEGYAAVEFEGIDGQHYQATWSVRRARNRADGSLQAFTVSLRNCSTHTDIPGKKTELLAETERLVGLNFEQFTRSVLLAQGDFTAFLKAGKDEKSALLEKLTGTSVYSDISRQVFENHRNEAQELRELNLQREGIPTLTPEELSLHVQQQEALTTTLSLQQEAVDALKREIGWQERLAALQKGLAQATAAHEKALAEKKDAAAREQRLRQAEWVQPARTWVTGRQTAEKGLTDKTTALQQQQASLEHLQVRQNDLDKRLETAVAELAAHTRAREEAQPLSDAAKALDVQLDERKKQTAQAAAELRASEEKWQQQQQVLEKKQLEEKQLSERIDRLANWKSQHVSRQPIAENQQFILSKLEDAHKQLIALQSLSAPVQKAGEAISAREQQKTTLVSQLAGARQQLETLQQTYQVQRDVQAAVSVAALEQDKGLADAQVETIIAAIAHWKVRYKAMLDYQSLQRANADHQEQLSHQKEQLAKAAARLSDAKIQWETSLRMMEKARLAAAENVESLRAQLLPGDPCPVCGSTAHPYTSHHPRLDQVLAALETGHRQHETTYTTCLTTHSSLQENGLQLEKMIAAQLADLALRDAELRQLQEGWDSFEVPAACTALPDEQKADWLLQHLSEKRAIQKRLQEQIRHYKIQQEQLDLLRQETERLDKQLTENTNRLKDTERALESLREQLQQHHRDQTNATALLSETEQNLSPYFPTANWFEHWKQKPELFLQQIKQFSEQWKSQQQQFEEDTRQHGILSANLQALQEQAQHLQEDVLQKKKTLSDRTEELDALTGTRKQIFNGEAVNLVERRLKQAVETAQQTVTALQEEREKLHTLFTRTKTQIEQSEAEILTLQQQLAGYRESIRQWLASYNARVVPPLEEDELVALLTLTPEWIASERDALRVTDDAVTHALSVWNERNAQLQDHLQQQGSDRSPEQLTLLWTEAREALQQTIQEQSRITVLLRQDEANKHRIKGLLQTIEKKALIVENWARLNDSIGSADGKKFRQIAQEYTLDVLLSYANIHLEMLSRRYLLQRIPSTLGLQVLDQDMGNEVRTVYSLSGGESFLVSLALALGLASLSSSRMKVESLFIDEGFGSLDPDTLNIAMDALERLHNQGRKVGVISHVQEMTERIPVQIQVSKQLNGKSKVIVRSNY